MAGEKSLEQRYQSHPDHPLLQEQYPIVVRRREVDMSFAAAVDHLKRITDAGESLTKDEIDRLREIRRSIVIKLKSYPDNSADSPRSEEQGREVFGLNRAIATIDSLLPAPEAPTTVPEPVPGQAPEPEKMSDEKKAALYFIGSLGVPNIKEAGNPNETESQFFDRIVDGLHGAMTEMIFDQEYLRTNEPKDAFMRPGEENILFFGPQKSAEVLQANYATKKYGGVEVLSIQGFLFKINSLFDFKDGFTQDELARRVKSLQDRLTAHSSALNGAANFRTTLDAKKADGLLAALGKSVSSPLDLESIFADQDKNGEQVRRTDMEKKLVEGESFLVRVFSLFELSKYELEEEGLEAGIPGYKEFLDRQIAVLSTASPGETLEERNLREEQLDGLLDKRMTYLSNPDFKDLGPNEVNIYKYLTDREKFPWYKSGDREKKEFTEKVRQDLALMGITDKKQQYEVMSYGVAYRIRSQIDMSIDDVVKMKNGVPEYTVTADGDFSPKLLNWYSYLRSRDKDEENQHPNKAIDLGHTFPIWARRMHYTYVENGVKKRDSVARIAAMGKMHLIDWSSKSPGNVDEAVFKMAQQAESKLLPKMFCNAEGLPFKLKRVLNKSILNSSEEKRALAKPYSARESLATLQSKIVAKLGASQPFIGSFDFDTYLVDGFEAESEPDRAEEIVKKYFDDFIIYFIKYWLTPFRKGVSSRDVDGAWDFISSLRHVFSSQSGPVNDVIKTIFDPALTYDKLNSGNVDKYVDAIYKQVYDYLLYNVTFDMMWYMYLPAFFESPKYVGIPFMTATTDEDFERLVENMRSNSSDPKVKSLTVEKAKEMRQEEIREAFKEMRIADREEWSGTSQSGIPLLASPEWEEVMAKSVEIRRALTERKSPSELEAGVSTKIPEEAKKKGKTSLPGIGVTYNENGVWIMNPAYDGRPKQKDLIFSREELLKYLQTQGVLEGREFELVENKYLRLKVVREHEEVLPSGAIFSKRVNKRLGRAHYTRQDLIDKAILFKALGSISTD